MIRWEQDRLCLSGSLFLCSENLQFGLENSKAMFFSAPHSICSSEAEHSLFFPWRQLGIHLWIFTLIFLLGKRFWWSQGCDTSRRVKSGWEAQLAGKSRWLLKVKLRHLPRVSLHELLQFDTGMFSQAAGFFRKQIRNPFSTEKLRKICGRFSSSHNRKEHFC